MLTQSRILSVVTSTGFVVSWHLAQINVEATVVCTDNSTLYQTKGGRCTTYTDNVVIGSWYIWVALIVGLVLLSVVTGIYHRYRMRNRVTYLNAIATGHRGNMTVQIISGQQQSFPGRPIMIPTINTYGNPGHFFEPPAAGYIMQPPPYSPAKRTAAPPPYRNEPAFIGNNFNGMPPPLQPAAGEKDNKDMGLSVIHPMQPAYINQGGPMEGGMNYPHTPLYDNSSNMYSNFTGGNAFLNPNYPVGPPSYPGAECVPSTVPSRNAGTRTPGTVNLSLSPGAVNPSLSPGAFAQNASPSPSHGQRTPTGNVRPTTSARSTLATPTPTSPRTPAPGGPGVHGAPAAPQGPVAPGPPPTAPLMETRHM